MVRTVALPAFYQIEILVDFIFLSLGISVERDDGHFLRVVLSQSLHTA